MKRSRQKESALPSKGREIGILSLFLVLALILIGADLAYFSTLETTPEPLSEAREDAGDQNAECGYKSDIDPVEDYDSLVNFMDPVKGSPDAPVTVIEYFDPNCPHCATMFPVMEKLAESHGDKARFHFKIFVLWQQSVVQSAALYAAAQEGKFFDMLQRQFAMQNPRGLSIDQLRQIASEIGMDPNVLVQRIQSPAFSSLLQQTRDKAMGIGITSVPAVLINGRVVALRSLECIGQLIDEAAAS